MVLLWNGVRKMWVYLKTEAQLWTVGFFGPEGKWFTESDWPSAEEAAERVHYLNGGSLTG